MNSAPHRRYRRRITACAAMCGAVVAATTAVVAQPAHAADEVLSVNFSTVAGTPTYRASGWIYGMTADASGPPDHFFTDVKFRYMRAGGAQLDSQGGWFSGHYDKRWAATKAQLVRTHSLNADFVLLVHDLWGADGSPISRFPGDDGDWSDYDAFLTRLIDDVRATGVPVQWDIWNEPNLSMFWNRSQAQYFEMWRRGYQRIRAAFPDQLIVGPSYAGVPTTSNSWWTQFLDYVKANKVVPDLFSWHSLPGDPVSNVAAANGSLDTRGIAHPRAYQINEYGASNEQNPGDGAWYIARLERAGADGLRANWAGGSNLHNDLANLLTRTGGQYQPKGEWWVYKFYASQTGQIVGVTPSSHYDGFATKDTGAAKVLVGGGTTTGNVAVNLQRLDTTEGIVLNNQVRVLVQRVPYNGGGAVSGPVTVADSVQTLSGTGVTVNVPHTNADDTFTITVLPPTGAPVSPSGSPNPGPDGSSPGTKPAGNQQIVGVQSGRCLDVPNSGNGAQAQLDDCTGSTGQTWTYGADKTLKTGGKCLDASNRGTSNGTSVVLWDCNGQTNQQWNVDANGTISGVNSGLCLDAYGAATGNGTKIVLWACNGGANQRWNLTGGPSASPSSQPSPSVPASASASPPQGGSLPCDIYAAGGTPCIAAHSTTRAVRSNYQGSLYQVRRASDRTAKDIGVLSPGGPVNAAAQDAFCAGTTCVVTVLYDQSGHGNDLWYQGSTTVPGSPQSSPAKATSESLTVNGSKAYSLYINPGNSYWRDGHLTGVPTGAAPEGMYMVTSGTHVNGGCCFDYGNSETTRSADAAGAMDAINFSTQCWFGGCSGNGPWVQADLEWGLFPGGSKSWNTNQRAFNSKFVTAMLKNNGSTRMALKGSNAQSGTLTTLWDGGLPGGYNPMKKQGAIILGSGGDCCKPNGGANLSAGTFYEGAMVAGYPTDATENEVQASVVAAGYR